MTGAGRPRVAGWYRDPADPTRLRHWTGDGWDGRRRNVPAWSIASADFVAEPEPEPDRSGPVPDGPVRHALHPARSTTGASVLRRHLLGPAARGGRPGVSPAAGRHRVAGRPPPPPPWRRRRNPLIVLAAFVGVVVLTVTAVVGGVAARGRVGSLPPLAADPTFVHAANAACGASIGAARLASGATMSRAGTPAAPSLSAVETANGVLGRLRRQLAGIGTGAPGRSGLRSWLDGWVRFSAARLRLAAFDARQPAVPAAATSSATTTEAASLSASVRSAAATADRFAVANDLGACTLVAGAASAYEPIP